MSSSFSSSFTDPARPGPLDTEVAIGLLKRGQALAEQGDWDLAAGTFARVVGAEDPALHTAALIGLADCRYRLDDEPAALQALITATQAPENELSWRAWKELAATRVRENDIAGAARAYREAGRRAPASEQAAIQSRVGWLSKEMGDDSGAERAFSQTRAEGRPQPIATYAVIAVTVVTSLATLMGAVELESWLMLDKAAVYFDDQYWRLLSVALVHDSNLPIHLIFNMYALFIIGPIIEALYGPRRFLLIYVICIAAGSVASLATSPIPGVGASGGVFGLFGALLVADRVHKPALTRNARNLTMQIGVLIGINLLIGFSLSGIDNAAHIGGLVAGAILGFVIVPQGTRLDSFWTRPSSGPTSPTDQGIDPVARLRPLRILSVIALIGVIVVIAFVGPITYEPPPWWLAGQPGVVTEVARDVIPIATGQAGVLLGQRRILGRRVKGQVDDQRPAWLGVRSLISQQQSQPGRHAATQLQATVDRPTLEDVGTPEGIAA